MSRLPAALGFATALLAPLVACSGSTPVKALDDTADGGADADGGARACAGPCPASKIDHLVVIVQENKTFDAQFGRYCTAPTGSSPTCNQGPACCEAAPATDPSGAKPTNLDDAFNGLWDPSHKRACEVEEIDGGKMDKFVTGSCGSTGNFAYADPAVVKPLWDLAATGALADRWFQPVVGQSAANDMYLARAQWVFDDNLEPQGAVGADCNAVQGHAATFMGTTIGDLLTAASVPWTFYAEGYDRMKSGGGACPPAPADCPGKIPTYPCDFDPGDVPFEFYASTMDKAPLIADYTQLATDLAGGTLPAVSFVKALGYKTEHPGNDSKISDGMKFITSTVAAVQGSPYAASTLVLVTYDEGGGYFDHVAPPPDSAVDHQPYGTRVPAIALGPFAKKGFVSHVTLEHSSIVKFIEWNWLGKQTGQLAGRDTQVANLGSLLDPSATGEVVPEN